MKITIKTIPHKEQRYDTVGDWLDDGSISVSDMGNKDYEFLIALHELIEMHLCNKRGITEESVTAFDVQFEKERKDGSHDENDEPGDDGRAPYFHEHQFATQIEREVAEKLGVDWKTYDDAVLKVGNPTEPTISDENKANTGDYEDPQAKQDGQSEGIATVSGGGYQAPSEHQEGGTPGWEGQGTGQDEVPQ